jgi:hypothetical protein
MLIAYLLAGSGMGRFMLRYLNCFYELTLIPESWKNLILLEKENLIIIYKAELALILLK